MALTIVPSWTRGIKRPTLSVTQGGKEIGLSGLQQQMYGTPAASADYLKSLGLPDEVVGLFSGLTPERAKLAGLEYKGSEDARQRAEAAQRAALGLVENRLGLAPDATSSEGTPIIDQFLKTALLDKQRNFIEQQRTVQIERARESYAGRGLGNSGPLNKEIARINSEADAATRGAQRDATLTAIQRGDTMSLQLAGMRERQQFSAPDYGSLLSSPDWGVRPSIDFSRFTPKNQDSQPSTPQPARRDTGGQPPWDWLQWMRQQGGASYDKGGQTVNQEDRKSPLAPQAAPATPASSWWARPSSTPPSGTFDGLRLEGIAGAITDEERKRKDQAAQRAMKAAADKMFYGG